jgi:hypothetical protein
MTNLEELFSVGNISKEITVKNVTFRIAMLNVKVQQEALNGAVDTDPISHALEIKKQTLARAITHINGNIYIQDVNNPNPETVKHLLEILNKLHFSVINALYDQYNDMDEKIKQDMDDEVKKSSKNPGV